MAKADQKLEAMLASIIAEAVKNSPQNGVAPNIVAASTAASEPDPAPLEELPLPNVQPGEKWSIADYYRQGISQLRGEIFVDKNGKKQRATGIHSVYSGFNEGLRDYFPGIDVTATTNKMVAEGVITTWPAKGGVKLYLPSERVKGEKVKKTKFEIGADGFPVFK